jgi:hypothetical protein
VIDDEHPGRARALRRARSGRGTGTGCDEQGRVTLLVLFYLVVCAGLVLAVSSAAAVHLARHRLQATADAAALDAADALDEGRFYGEGAGDRSRPVPVADVTVRDSVRRYLAAAGAEERLPGLAVAGPTGTSDGVTAEVTLTMIAPVPVLGALLDRWSQGVPVTVTSRARAAQKP